MEHTEYSREEAAKRSLDTKANVPGSCQLMVRTWLGAPSAGDVDHDGDADAVDGWKSEPARFKHTDRRPPRGTPGAFTGGSRGFGHRVLSLGVKEGDRESTVRSTDFDGKTKKYRPGKTGNGLISEVERAFGTITWAGWSDTMDGLMIENDNPEPTRGPKVEHALEDLDAAQGTGRRRRLIRRAAALLRKIKFLGRH